MGVDRIAERRAATESRYVELLARYDQTGVQPHEARLLFEDLLQRDDDFFHEAILGLIREHGHVDLADVGLTVEHLWAEPRPLALYVNLEGDLEAQFQKEWEQEKQAQRREKKAQEIAAAPKPQPEVVQKPKPNMGGIISDPVARAKKGKANLQLVLDWLRQEPYSTATVMALVLKMSVPGARRVLNQFVKHGWLVRDEMPFPGVRGKLLLFGISTRGLYHLMREDDVEPAPHRDFKRGRVSPTYAAHVLNIQLARLYLQRLNNPEGKFRRYTAARDLPGYGFKAHKWDTYPDAIIENGPYAFRSDPRVNVAIEVEQHTKGSTRYRSIVKGHLTNAEPDEGFGISDRYDLVIYYRETSDDAKNLKRTFERLIDRMHFDSDRDRAIAKQRFRYDTYSDLPDRIRALDKEEAPA